MIKLGYKIRSMSTAKQVDPSFLRQLISEHHNLISANEKLISLGWDETSIQHCLTEFKKYKNNQRQTRGFIYLISGGALGFMSCVLSIVNPVPELYDWFLYGFTSVAILLACYGLYNIFE